LSSPEAPDGARRRQRDGGPGCVGVALGLLDAWPCGPAGRAPTDLARQVGLPAGHWAGEQAATDILQLARKGRAFSSIDSLTLRQGGKHVLYGGALAVAAVMRTWSRATGTPFRRLTRTEIR
jgi:hypothetical protein